MTQLLIPGLTCASVHRPPAAGLLIDGHHFYKAINDSFLAAKRSILMAGWQFNSNVALLRGSGCSRGSSPTKRRSIPTILAHFTNLCPSLLHGSIDSCASRWRFLPGACARGGTHGSVWRAGLSARGLPKRNRVRIGQLVAPLPKMRLAWRRRWTSSG